jgi:hypothetical protein
VVSRLNKLAQDNTAMIFISVFLLTGDWIFIPMHGNTF